MAMQKGESSVGASKETVSKNGRGANTTNISTSTSVKNVSKEGDDKEKTTFPLKQKKRSEGIMLSRHHHYDHPQSAEL